MNKIHFSYNMLHTPNKVLKTCFVTVLMACGLLANAQEGSTGYQFLEIPTSAHAAALGGNNISIIEDDASLLFTNPALTVNSSDKTLNLNYASYISSTNKLSASFVKHMGERGTWAFGAQLLNYGDLIETDANFNTIGEFSAKDIDIQAGYAYLFTDYLSGGVQGKVLLSNYGEFKSTAIAVDLGLNYYTPELGWSFSLVAQNLGGQVDALYETHEKMPFNLAFGVSKDFENAPIRLSVTFDKLTDWDVKKPIHHLTFGADIFPSSTTWVAIGINPRRSKEMKIQDSSHWAGVSLGAGLSLKKIKIGLAYGKYHVAASSLLINASYAF